MLKAYDYADTKYNAHELQHIGLFNKEKSAALEFVLSHSNSKVNTICPICKSDHTQYIFSRWDINYLFCEECYSIFVPVEKEMIEEYLKSEKLRTVRCSKEYQEQAQLRRADIWDEFIMWARYRSYRYLKKNTGLDVIDYGNRYEGFIKHFIDSGMCGKYELRNSILSIETVKVDKADVILYLNQLQHEVDPVATLRMLKNDMKEDGILILHTRLGSGFDILTLKGGMDSLFPYEHIMLPSRKGLEKILQDAGFELLEITTPGTRDMDAVLKNQNRIEGDNFFVKYLLKIADRETLSDFQQFLQKSGLSSFAQIVAKARR